MTKKEKKLVSDTIENLQLRISVARDKSDMNNDPTVRQYYNGVVSGLTTAIESLKTLSVSVRSTDG